jgi:hypothetical protein
VALGREARNRIVRCARGRGDLLESPYLGFYVPPLIGHRQELVERGSLGLVDVDRLGLARGRAPRLARVVTLAGTLRHAAA